VSLYPGAGVLTAQVILKDDRIALVPSEMMIPELCTAIESAPPYAEGRWIFFAVSSRPKLEVAKTLISLRARAASLRAYSRKMRELARKLDLLREARKPF